jgi:predicted transcriptional regulator
MEIAAKIIEIARKRVTKTSIMYGAALSYFQLNDYLEFMQANELLEYTSEKRLYHTTEKGMRFLNGYQELQHMLYPKESEELLLKKSKV